MSAMEAPVIPAATISAAGRQRRVSTAFPDATPRNTATGTRSAVTAARMRRKWPISGITDGPRGQGLESELEGSSS